MEGSGQFYDPATLYRGERAPVTHWIGGRVGPRASMDKAAKRKDPIAPA